MKITSERRNISRLLPSLVIALAVSFAVARAADEPKGKLEGTWSTQVAIRNCQTNDVVRTFPAVNTFSQDETMLDTTAGISPALRTPGLGTWERTGSRTYSAKSLAFLFNPAGVWIGTQKLTHTIEVNGDENRFTSSIEITDPAGNVVSTGCATAVGHRL